MTLLPHPATRLFGVSLAIHWPKLDIILSALGARISLADPAASVGYTPAARTSGPPSGKVAVISIRGTLACRTSGPEVESGSTNYTGIAAQLDAALTSPEVAATLFDIDSPGGESGGVFDLVDRIRVASQVKSARAMANDVAFSTAYVLVSAVTRVLVARTGGVGSIGIIAMHIDQSVKDAKDGVRYIAASADKCKNDLNPHESLFDAAHAVLKAKADHVYELLVETVARHRGLDADAMRVTETGLFFGPDAVATGLVDAADSLDDTPTQLAQSPSSPPTQVAPASQADSFRNYQMESPMNDRTNPIAPDRPLTDPVGSPPQPSAASIATVLSVADAVKIVQIRTLAGRTDLIAGFLGAQSSSVKVRSQLLVVQAEASLEITSRIAPDTACPVASNPLIDTAKQIAAQSTKKEV